MNSDILGRIWICTFTGVFWLNVDYWVGWYWTIDVSLQGWRCSTRSERGAQIIGQPFVVSPGDLITGSEQDGVCGYLVVCRSLGLTRIYLPDVGGGCSITPHPPCASCSAMFRYLNHYKKSQIWMKGGKVNVRHVFQTIVNFIEHAPRQRNHVEKSWAMNPMRSQRKCWESLWYLIFH